MTAFKRIMVGVDGSDNSIRAAQNAAVLASVFDSDIVLLFGINPWESAYYTGLPTMEGAERAKRNYRPPRTKELCEEAGSEPMLKVAQGKLVEAILDLSVIGYDLVVLRAQGINAMARFLMGGVSTQVVQLSKVPVMAVP